jgi:hypothetical protein
MRRRPNTYWQLPPQVNSQPHWLDEQQAFCRKLQLLQLDATHAGGGPASGIGATHEPLLQTCPLFEQSVHALPPAAPQAVVCSPLAQSPDAVQQPVAQNIALHGGFESGP